MVRAGAIATTVVLAGGCARRCNTDPPADPSASIVTALAVAPPGDAGLAAGLLPADRATVWNPGLNAVNGIPRRTTVCATISPTGGDDTATIQSALDKCPSGSAVELEVGTFRITGQGLTIGHSGVVLRGRGPDRTRLVKPAGTNYPVISLGQRWFGYTQPTDLAADGIKGAHSVTLVRDPGLKAGEIVHIDQLTNEALTYWGPRAPAGSAQRGWFARPDRPIGQVMEVASVSGNTVTFTTPLHIDFKRTSKAQLVRLSNVPDGPPLDAVKYAGVEDLYVAYGEGGDGGGNIHLFSTAYSWLKNIESDASLGNSVNFDHTFRCVLRDSYIHSTVAPNPGGAGYGVGVNVYAADNLIENNAIWNFNKVDVFRASGGGNVFGYNYLEDGYGAGYKTFVEVGLNASHYTTPHHELFEGNESFNFDGDSVWGNSIYITVFRNHFTGKRRSVPPLALTDEQNHRVIGLSHKHWWYSFLGNVLGTEGQKPDPAKAFVYEKNDHFGDWSRAAIWQLGYEDWSLPQDKSVLETVIRHGNFDYFTQKVVYDPRFPRQLPPSLYLTAKPEFLGSEPWPLVDPERAQNRVGVLPARKRFDARH